MNRLGVVLGRSVNGSHNQGFLSDIDKVVLGSLRNNDEITSINRPFLARNHSLGLALSEQQVLIDVVDLE